MRSQMAYISELPKTTVFNLNGTTAKKVSSRTVLFIDYGRRFYFQKREYAIVGAHSRLSADYFEAQA